MAICLNLLRLTKMGILFTLIGFSIGASQNSFSQSIEKQSRVSAIDIAHQIEDMSLVESNTSKELIKPTTSTQARKQILEALPSGDRDRFEEAVSLYHQFAIKTNSEREMKVLELFETFSNNFDFQNLGANYDELVDILESYSKSKDWLVSFHAKLLLSLVHTHSRKYSLALGAAQEALDLIPNTLSEEAQESRITATELLAYLQNLTANKELAIYNTQKVIDLKLEAGQPIDGVELLNNIMHSLSEWRDYETRLEIAKTLKRLEAKFGSTTPGLSDTHIARINNDIGNYSEALIAAQSALKTANIDTVRRNAKIQIATAYAGLGDTEKAKSILDSISFDSDTYGTTRAYTYALIALKEGQTDKALALMNERYDRKVIQILQTTNNGTMEMLAGLENSSERQAEREEALQRESALIQTRLDQQQRINKLLIAFLLLVAISGICALLFARHRDKLAKLLAIKSREAESADRMKTEFLGMVSHELRTPLNGIIGLADILASSGPTEEVRQRGEIILSSGNILFTLIESIIDMSRLEAGKLELTPEPTSLKSYIEENLEPFETRSAEKGLLFTSYISPECGQEVNLDSKRVAKCICTLLCNAIKFTDKGRVHLHVTSEKDPTSGQTEFTVIVADTGQGISEDVQTKLFTPFLQADASMTRKHGGSGLRLAISRMLARMMDGDITLTSRQGRGSEFTLKFKSAPADQIAKTTQAAQVKEEASKKKIKQPRKKRLSSSTLPNVVGHSFLTDVPPHTPKIEPVDFSQWRALIVEDNRTNQDVIALMLENIGLQYVPVESGEEALNILNTQRFDFVLMDIHMPGIDGVETTRRIRAGNESWSNIPILALTADSAAENNAACMAAGANMFLTKPVLAKDLIEALREMRKQIWEDNSAQTKTYRSHA